MLALGRLRIQNGTPLLADTDRLQHIGRDDNPKWGSLNTQVLGMKLSPKLP
ncbi:MAG: hypothetical protein IJP86_07730 [Synergistaceae bacterium]|nr:hypothetical protein [Synergistaceae bacterium]